MTEDMAARRDAGTRSLKESVEACAIVGRVKLDPVTAHATVEFVTLLFDSLVKVLAASGTVDRDELEQVIVNQLEKRSADLRRRAAGP